MSSGSLVFYRLVEDSIPKPGDFDSVMVSGKRAPNSREREEPELWSGISVFDNEVGARNRGNGRPSLGRFIARVEGIDPDWIVSRAWGRHGHHTVWASPIRLCDAVTAVIPV